MEKEKFYAYEAEIREGNRSKGKLICRQLLFSGLETEKHLKEIGVKRFVPQQKTVKETLWAFAKKFPTINEINWKEIGDETGAKWWGWLIK